MRHALEIGCLSIGILCLFYYAGIVIYAGITTSFAWIWLFGGAVLLLLWIALLYQRFHPYVWLQILTGTVFAVLTFVLVAVLVIGAQIVGAMHMAPQQNLEYVIVLGAQVRGSSPSRALRKRLECAAEYAGNNPDTVFILSGGQGADEDISEAECMYRFLVEAGVPEERLIMEDQSTSTAENLAFSAEILLSQCEDEDQSAASAVTGVNTIREDLPDVAASVGILSSDFHIYRVLLLAEKTGYGNVSGIPADSVLGMQPHNILREICAVIVLIMTSR